MEIIAVEDVLKALDESRPLRLIELEALKANREQYIALLLQPNGALQADQRRVGHKDQAAATKMCNRLLDIAVEKQIDLVVAPEYCIPWSVIDEVIAGARRPRPGSIWALGCESITPGELSNKEKALPEAVRLIHEPFDERQVAHKRFLDPLVYVFWAHDSASSRNVLCVLVQFKTVPCKDEGHIELTALYLGTSIYTFNRGLNTIGLMGLICSDVFQFTDQLIDEYHRNCLILHIQLNPKPTQHDYSAYRTRLYSVATNSHVEVLCLNWAREIIDLEASGKKNEWHNISGSAWYLAATKFDSTDTAIDKLHREGVYCTFVLSRHWHALYFNYEPAAFVVRKQKVFATGQQSLVPKTGLQIVEVLDWDSTANAWKTSIPNDGFAAVLTGYPRIQAQLQTLCIASSLSVERSLELLRGPQGSPETWYLPAELEALNVGADESIRSVTVNMEDDPQRSGVRFRRDFLTRAQATAALIGQPVPWPPAATALSGGFEFCWESSQPHCNVRTTSDTPIFATLVFLYDEPSENALIVIYNKLAQALRMHAIRNNSDPAKCSDRLCVVYRRDNILDVYRPKPFITTPGDTSPAGIANG